MRQTQATANPAPSKFEWATEIILLVGWTVICVFGFSWLTDLAGLPFALSNLLIIPVAACIVLWKRYTLPRLVGAGAGLGLLTLLSWSLLLFIQFPVTILTPASIRNALLIPFTVLDWLVVALLGLCNLLLLIGLGGALLSRVRASA
jgi:multisubunit Na+/H+ antiporter MnhB subunit